MSKVYKKDLDEFIPHKGADGKDILYKGQMILRELLGFLGLNCNALANKLGMKRADGLYRIRDGETKKISADLAIKIHKKFKNISLLWLLTGDGNIEAVRNVDNDAGDNAENTNSGQPGTGETSMSKESQLLAQALRANRVYLEKALKRELAEATDKILAEIQKVQK